MEAHRNESYGFENCVSPLRKHEKHRPYHQAESNYIIPLQLFSQIYDGENTEYHKGDDLLNGLELGGGEPVMTDSVCGNLKAVFREGDYPANHDHFPESRVFVTKMPVPREGHEDI